ncbi:hypothetical protein MHYP_G00199020 [Metynnis hypsauchen]
MKTCLSLTTYICTMNCTLEKLPNILFGGFKLVSKNVFQFCLGEKTFAIIQMYCNWISTVKAAQLMPCIVHVQDSNKAD